MTQKSAKILATMVLARNQKGKVMSTNKQAVPKILVVGTGLYGATFANYLAYHDIPVTVMEQFEQPGGLAFDEKKPLYDNSTEKQSYCYLPMYGLTTLYKPSVTLRDYLKQVLGCKLIPVWWNCCFITKSETSQAILPFSYLGTSTQEQMRLEIGARIIKDKYKYVKEYYEAIEGAELKFRNSHKYIPSRGWSSLITEMLSFKHISLQIPKMFSLDMTKDYDIIIYTGQLDNLIFKAKEKTLEYVYVYSNSGSIKRNEYPIGLATNTWFSESYDGFVKNIEASRIWDLNAELIWIRSVNITKPNNTLIPFRPAYSTFSKLLHSKLKGQLLSQYPNITLGGPTATWTPQSPEETMEAALHDADKLVEKII